MTITFLAHSGFLVEWEHFYTLFDWWKGALPPLKTDKPLLVFASHAHEDHFDKHIFALPETYPLTRYVLSHDIRLAARRWEKLGMTEELFARVTSMRADSVFATEAGGAALTVRTVKSTDIGVAFLLSAEGKLVYHAGDLNWWHWTDEGKQYCDNMAESYRRAIAKLAGAVRDEAADCGCAPMLDVAMAPLDPRLGDAYDKGVAYLMEQIPVKRLFPMHVWEKFDWIDRYRREHPADAERIAPIRADGETFPI
ncbi:MAG: MBL fold metallo-hydrolase [Oscillospiraceae bacterium]|nr:MBL fold metallo-hydrolase [Oscillospiraceae bacterium]